MVLDSLIKKDMIPTKLIPLSLLQSFLLLASFENMRIHNSLLPFLILLTLLSMVHLSYGRNLNIDTTTTESFLQSTRRFVAVSRFVEFEGRKVKSEYDVSHRVVPCGPNPLHN